MLKLLIIIILVSSAISKNVPRYADLDEDDQLLFRAAYDTSSYDHEEYQEDEELPVGKLDLLKDGMWAIKAKLKEMKTINKALAANLLLTKLQVKELLTKSIKVLKTHHHIDIEKKKPVYTYQTPPQPHVYHQYEAPHYTAPVPQYEAPHYAAPGSQYNEPPHYNAPKPHQYNEPPHYTIPVPQQDPSYHDAPRPQYDEPPHFTASVPQYNEPPNAHYNAPVPQYETHHYGAPQYGHDPYYGH